MRLFLYRFIWCVHTVVASVYSKAAQNRLAHLYNIITFADFFQVPVSPDCYLCSYTLLFRIHTEDNSAVKARDPEQKNSFCFLLLFYSRFYSYLFYLLEGLEHDKTARLILSELPLERMGQPFCWSKLVPAYHKVQYNSENWEN